MNKRLRRLTFSALCVALCYVLPMLTGHIQQFGSMLLPMHLPVLLCGLVCGWPWGLAVGFVAPLLISLTTGMPPLWPVAVSMAFELGAYGFLSGFFSRLFPRKLAFAYLTLVISMVGGRLVWGLVNFLLAGLQLTDFSLNAFLAGAVLTAWPGIVVQILLLPPVAHLLRRTRLLE